MPKFKYTAINKQGKELKGAEEAPGIQEVIKILRDRGLFPVNVLPEQKNRFSFSLNLFKNTGVNRKTLTITTRQLATLVAAGLPLVRAIRIIEQQQKGAWKRTLSGLIESVEGGSSFSDALARYPKVFSKLFINMIKAGEAAGVLDVVLGRLAGYFEKSQQLRGKVISALIYPILVLLFALSILILLMIFVVPKFAGMFSDMNVPLPAVTQFLINFSNGMLTLKFWIVLVIIAILLKILFKIVSSYEKTRYFFDKVKLKMPIIGNLIQKVIVSRFARTLGTLVASGVPILSAITNVKDSIDNEVMRRGLDVVHDSVKEGESIVEPLKQCPVFDPVVVNMVGVGEETGRLDDMLIRVADTYDSEVDVLIAGITSLLEPFLIIFLACIVGFIVIALFMPLLSMLNSLAV